MFVIAVVFLVSEAGGASTFAQRSWHPPHVNAVHEPRHTECACDLEQSKAEIELVELTNAERKKLDLPPLKLNAALSKVARAHAENMLRQDKMEHVLDKKGPLDRIREAGYKFSKAAENIGYAEEGATLAGLTKAWMDSKVHRVNIVSPDFTEIGIGIAQDKAGTRYFTQLFARPK